MNFKTRVTFSTLFCIFAMVALLISCVDIVVSNRHFYNFAYDQFNIAESIGMSESDLYEASDTLLDYLQGYREDIKVKVRFQQEEKEVFNVKETLHMVDVKNLYQSALLIRNIMLLFMGILFTLLYYDDKKGVKSVLTYTYQRFFVFFALFLGGLITYAACDFTTFWTLFHKLLFRNNLWMLDPLESIMIQMFPEHFFFTMVAFIALLFVFIALFLWFYSIHDQKKAKN